MHKKFDPTAWSRLTTINLGINRVQEVNYLASANFSGRDFHEEYQQLGNRRKLGVTQVAASVALLLWDEMLVSRILSRAKMLGNRAEASARRFKTHTQRSRNGATCASINFLEQQRQLDPWDFSKQDELLNARVTLLSVLCALLVRLVKWKSRISCNLLSGSSCSPWSQVSNEPLAVLDCGYWQGACSFAAFGCSVVAAEKNGAKGNNMVCEMKLSTLAR